MRILYITHTKDGSGARMALVNMAKGLIDKGHVVYVITPAKDCLVSNSMREIGANVLVAPVCSTVYPKTNNFFKWIVLLVISLFKWIMAKNRIKRAIINYDIDIVHTNVGPLNLAPSVCRRLKIPHVWHIREFQDLMKINFYPTSSKFKKEIYKYGNYNIAITNSVFQHYSLRNNFDRVIYDGVFPAKVSLQSIQPYSQRGKVILYVGRIERTKGTIDLITAFFSFLKKHEGWSLRVVGSYIEEDAYYQECKRVIAENGRNDVVSFWGKRSDVYDLMKQAKILVVPSLYEGFGFVTAEGMANGCLVIGRNVGGIKEQFDNGKKYTGKEIALRFETQEELLEQLNNAVENDYHEMIERGRYTAVELYSLERTSEQVEKYYKWIINNYNETKS